MCETIFYLNDILWRKRQVKKKQKQDSLQQKQHNRKSTQHIICIYSSVAISDGLYYQCANTTAGCEHQKQQKQKQQNRNSTQHRIIVHLHPLPCRSIVVRIGARTLPFTCVPFRWSYRLALSRVVFNCPRSLHHARPSCRHHGRGIHVGGIDA